MLMAPLAILTVAAKLGLNMSFEEAAHASQNFKDGSWGFLFVLKTRPSTMIRLSTLADFFKDIYILYAIY